MNCMNCGMITLISSVAKTSERLVTVVSFVALYFSSGHDIFALS